jgi:hypothetical protein
VVYIGMTNIHVIRYTTRPEAVQANTRLVAGVYDELAALRPDGLCYATLLLPAAGTFLHVVADEAGASPLPQLGAFREFQRDLADRVLAPPLREAATVVGAYRFG